MLYSKLNPDGKLVWVSITIENINEYPYLDPLTHFILHNTGAQVEELTFNYKDLVWDPSFEEDVTPNRSLMSTALSSKPAEVDTTLEGSAIFNNPEPSFPLEHDER